VHEVPPPGYVISKYNPNRFDLHVMFGEHGYSQQDAVGFAASQGCA
jgi:hypothetical protein